jgi:predicted RNA-binding protein with PIN domain
VAHADPSLYLFDGYNVLHAGSFASVRELVDRLAGFVALKGARGVVVFDGAGADDTVGQLEVRYAPHADALLERLAAEHRGSETVALVSSDSVVRGTVGQEVVKIGSARFAGELAEPEQAGEPAQRVSDRLDSETRARLEELRRGRRSG